MSAIEIKDSCGFGAMRAEMCKDTFGRQAIQLSAGCMPCIFSLYLAPNMARELAAALTTMADELDPHEVADAQPPQRVAA